MKCAQDFGRLQFPGAHEGAHEYRRAGDTSRRPPVPRSTEGRGSVKMNQAPCEFNMIVLMRWLNLDDGMK